MTNFVALPLIVTLAATLGGSLLWGRLQPAAAARVGTISLLSVLVAAVPTLWLIGLSGFAHVGVHNPLFDWSDHVLPSSGPLGTVVGVGSLAVAVVGTVRVAQVIRIHRRIRCVDTAALQVVPSDDLFAYTIPGPARTIAVSRGLQESLDADELEVVLAHERAHARHRHDRLLLLAHLTSAFVPGMRPLAKRVEFFIERWADEEAVVAQGGDRRFVARTIAKVALSSTPPAPALGIAAHGVAARANALLVPIETARRSTSVAVWFLVAVTISQAFSQLHHTALFGTGLLT